MALAPAFSLLHSEFNDFLYAPIGEEPNGVALSVISALTRLGIDPWEEAARLSQLGEDAAIQTLTARIAGFPGGGWTQSDARGIATRLVALLPYVSVARTAERAQPSQSGGRFPSRWLTWIAFGLLSVLIWYLLFWR